MFFRFICALYILTLALSTTSSVSFAEATVFDRVAVIGASVSVGFGTSTNVKDFFEKALPTAQVKNHADLFMSMNPSRRGSTMIDQTIVENPTFVFAIDYLFWYAYGRGSAASRMQFFRSGLDELDRLLQETDAVVALGDLPDMKGASSYMLSADLIPPSEQLSDMNEVLRHWAEGRKNIVLLPLASWSTPLHTPSTNDNKILVRLPSGENVDAQSLLTGDHLHLTEQGLWYVLDKSAQVIEGAIGSTGHIKFVPYVQ
jgi:hypothetical protein